MILQPKVQKIFVKPGTVALMLDCSRSKVYELIASGAIPSVRLENDRMIRVPLAALTRMATEALLAVDEDAND
jgi:excisionase family DNA binding protein